MQIFRRVLVASAAAGAERRAGCSATAVFGASGGRGRILQPSSTPHRLSGGAAIIAQACHSICTVAKSCSGLKAGNLGLQLMPPSAAVQPLPWRTRNLQDKVCMRLDWQLECEHTHSSWSCIGSCEQRRFKWSIHQDA